MASLSALSTDFLASLGALGEAVAEPLAAALDTEPSVALRLNRRKATPIFASLYPDMREVEWCSDGRRLATRPIFTLNPLLHAGGFYVQDPSSMIHQQIMERIVALTGGAPLTLLDFCAAPGGKTTAMINALPDGSAVVANEYVPARGKILRENLEKWGYPGIITTGAEAADYASLGEVFDVVAVDAPCSGEGMMRKDDEARRQWSPRLVEECAALQRSILSDIVSTLRPGGFLIYSTCTFNTLEDEDNSRFISEVLGLEQVDFSDLQLAGTENVAPSLRDDVSAMRFMPHLTEGEGLYVSIFRKPGELARYLKSAQPVPLLNLTDSRASRNAGKGAKSGKNGKSRGQGKERPTSDTILSKEVTARLQAWFDPKWRMRFICPAGLVSALPEDMTQLLAEISRAGIRITAAGLPAAEIKGHDLVADSRVALSAALREDAFPRVELSEEEAMKYLRRELATLPEGTPAGFVAVCYQGLPLGLMKNLGRRANNLYPAAWRVRMSEPAATK